MHELNAADAIVLSAFAIAAMRILTGPLGAAIADRIRGRRARDGEVARLAARVSEMEERLDFAERLLTSREPADQLPGGVHR
jgi:hypothetical protein